MSRQRLLIHTIRLFAIYYHERIFSSRSHYRPVLLLAATSNVRDNSESIEIVIDSQDFLNKMMEQASRVAFLVVKMSTPQNECAVKQVLLSSREIFLEMPSPIRLPDRKRRSKQVRFASESVDTQKDGLTLLCQAAENLPIVSPHLISSSSSDRISVPRLKLKDDDGHADSDNVSNLSIDQCASIVDTCLLGDDYTVEPSNKRHKI